MNIIEHHQPTIFEQMIQLQADLEGILQKIFEQAGSKIQPEKQAEVQQQLAGTQRLLERFKDRYGSR